MTLHLSMIAVLFVASIVSPDSAVAEVPPVAYRLESGPNRVDFTGDGIDDLVVVGHRRNPNGHSFDVVSFYAHADPVDGQSSAWHVVPLFRDEKETLQIYASGGAGCLLHDFRFFPETRSLVLADREFGESFGDSQTVTFTHFALVQEPTEEHFGPQFFFEQRSTSISKRKYCDVAEAFLEELGTEVQETT